MNENSDNPNWLVFNVACVQKEHSAPSHIFINLQPIFMEDNIQQIGKMRQKSTIE